MSIGFLGNFYCWLNGRNFVVKCWGLSGCGFWKWSENIGGVWVDWGMDFG